MERRGRSRAATRPPPQRRSNPSPAGINTVIQIEQSCCLCSKGFPSRGSCRAATDEVVRRIFLDELRNTSSAPVCELEHLPLQGKAFLRPSLRPRRCFSDRVYIISVHVPLIGMVRLQSAPFDDIVFISFCESR